jgi:hypothetical protein
MLANVIHDIHITAIFGRTSSIPWVFTKTNCYLSSNYKQHNDTDSKYIFKHTLSIQECRFHRKMPFHAKASSARKYTIQGYSADHFSQDSCQISIEHCHKS